MIFARGIVILVNAVTEAHQLLAAVLVLGDRGDASRAASAAKVPKVKEGKLLDDKKGKDELVKTKPHWYAPASRPAFPLWTLGSWTACSIANR